MTPPLCPCHGALMRWSKDVRRANGGRWRCYVHHTEQARHRYHTDALYRIRQIDRSRRNKALVRRRERQLRSAR